jgi:hypothetical protein
VQHERLIGLSLDQPGEVGLVERGVDDRVLVVVEQPKVPVKADVDAGGLHHRGVERVEADPTRRDLGADVAVGEQHACEGIRCESRLIAVGYDRRRTSRV